MIPAATAAATAAITALLPAMSPAPPSSAGAAFEFRAVLAGTIAERGTYERTETGDGCTFRVRGGGTRLTTFRSRRATRLVFHRSESGGARVVLGRLPGVGGQVEELLGSADMEALDCPGRPRAHGDCFGWKNRFAGAETRVVRLAAGRFGLAPLRHRRLAGPLRSCGPNFRSAATNVDVAAARVRESRLFARRVRRIVVRGSFAREDELSPALFGSGSLSIQVRWTLTLTRVAPRGN